MPRDDGKHKDPYEAYSFARSNSADGTSPWNANTLGAGHYGARGSDAIPTLAPSLETIPSLGPRLTATSTAPPPRVSVASLNAKSAGGYSAGKSIRESGRYGSSYYDDPRGTMTNPLESVMALTSGLPLDCAGYRPDKSQLNISNTGDVTLAANSKGAEESTEENEPPEANNRTTSGGDRDKERKTTISEMAGGLASNFVSFMTRGSRGSRASKKSLKDAAEVEQAQSNRATPSGKKINLDYILRRSPPFTPASPKNADYQWIRYGKSARNRDDRLLHASATCHAVSNQGYRYNGESIDLGVTKMLASVEYARPPADRIELRLNKESNQVFWTDMTAVEIGCLLVEDGSDVTVVNAASAYHCGGGFMSGGRHALEEAICTQSTLYFSLWQMYGGSSERYIPEKVAIISPHVKVFRGPSSEGYPFLPKATEITVASVAMPNFNSRVTDAPVIRFRDDQYCGLVEANFRRVLEAAEKAGSKNKPKTAVIPDIGCGVYENSPKLVGKILGNIIGEYRVERIVLTGHPEFAEHTMASHVKRVNSRSEEETRASEGSKTISGMDSSSFQSGGSSPGLTETYNPTAQAILLDDPPTAYRRRDNDRKSSYKEPYRDEREHRGGHHDRRSDRKSSHGAAREPAPSRQHSRASEHAHNDGPPTPTQEQIPAELSSSRMHQEQYTRSGSRRSDRHKK